jgi:hypothetical protein
MARNKMDPPWQGECVMDVWWVGEVGGGDQKVTGAVFVGLAGLGVKASSLGSSVASQAGNLNLFHWP